MCLLSVISQNYKEELTLNGTNVPLAVKIRHYDDYSIYSAHFAHIAYDFKPRSLLYSILGLMACSVLTNDFSSSGDT